MNLLRGASMLLYLNRRTFVGEAGNMLAREVEVAMAKGIELILIHELDPEFESCPFDHFFSTTPQRLVSSGIYAKIAVACHRPPFRSVSMGLVCKGLGAKTVSKRIRKAVDQAERALNLEKMGTNLRRLSTMNLSAMGAAVENTMSPMAQVAECIVNSAWLPGGGSAEESAATKISAIWRGRQTRILLCSPVETADANDFIDITREPPEVQQAQRAQSPGTMGSPTPATRDADDPSARLQQAVVLASFSHKHAASLEQQAVDAAAKLHKARDAFALAQAARETAHEAKERLRAELAAAEEAVATAEREASEKENAVAVATEASEAANVRAEKQLDTAKQAEGHASALRQQAKAKQLGPHPERGRYAELVLERVRGENWKARAGIRGEADLYI